MRFSRPNSFPTSGRLTKWARLSLAALVVLAAGPATSAPRGRRRADVARACLGGDAVACYDFALLLLDEATDSSAETEAAALLGSSCELGHAPACRRLGQAFEYGRGVERTPGAARSLYEAACCMGDDGACGDVKRMSAAPTAQAGRKRPPSAGLARGAAASQDHQRAERESEASDLARLAV
jgi:TPR repeat protein